MAKAKTTVYQFLSSYFVSLLVVRPVLSIKKVSGDMDQNQNRNVTLLLSPKIMLYTFKIGSNYNVI